MEDQEKKSKLINIRLTPTQVKLLQENQLSPTIVFNQALANTILDKRKITAKENAKNYPVTRAFFGVEWIERQIDKLKWDDDEGVNGHGLAWLFSRNVESDADKSIAENKRLAQEGNVDAGMMAWLQVGHYYEPVLKLREFEENLKTLKNEKRIKKTIEKARNEDQFWHTLSEIEVAAACKRKEVLLEIEPNIQGKTPDQLIQLNGQKFYLEVFTPQIADELNQAIKTGNAITLENKAWKKLDEKIDKLPKTVPTILVINRSFSEIDAINVADAILGTLALRIPKDSKKEPQTIRKTDGLIYQKKFENLKAIIIYKRAIDLNHGLITAFEVKPIIWDNDSNLTKQQTEKLEEIFASMNFAF